MNANQERRQLAARLRGLREAAGLSTTRLAALLGWSQSKVSKIENGRTKPAVADVQAWLAAVHAGPDQQAELVAFAESIQIASIIWDRTLGGGRPGHQRTLHRLQRDAVRVRVFQNAVVPGLLQTADYARRVLALADVFHLGDTATAAAARIERQAVLYEPRRAFEFVVTESALRFRPGPADVLIAQYDKILSACTLPTVGFSVLPAGGAATTVHAHPFVIHDLADETSYVTVETYTRELTLTDPEEVQLYHRVYDALRADSLHGNESSTFVAVLRRDTVAS